MKGIRMLCLKPREPRSFGGAAMEYIIVSTAAAVIAIAATAFAVKAFQEQIAKMQELTAKDHDVERIFSDFSR